MGKGALKRIIAIFIIAALIIPISSHGVEGQTLDVRVDIDFTNGDLRVRYDGGDAIDVLLSSQQGDEIEVRLDKVGLYYSTTLDFDILPNISGIKILSKDLVIYEGDIPRVEIEYSLETESINISSTDTALANWTLYHMYQNKVIRGFRMVRNNRDVTINNIIPGTRAFLTISKDNKLNIRASYYIPLIEVDLYNNKIRVVNNQDKVLEKISIVTPQGEEKKLLVPQGTGWQNTGLMLNVGDQVICYYSDGNTDTATIGYPYIATQQRGINFSLLGLNKGELSFVNTPITHSFVLENQGDGTMAKAIDYKYISNSTIIAKTKENHVISFRYDKYENKISFNDIQDEVMANIVGRLATMGVFSGSSRGIFNPDRTITKAEFITAIVNYLDTNIDVSSLDMKFQDLLTTDWFYGSIAKATALGIIDSSLEYFKPTEPIRGEEAMQYIQKVLTYKVGEEGLLNLSWIMGYTEAQQFSLKEALSNLSIIDNTAINQPIKRIDTALLIYNIDNLVKLLNTRVERAME